MKVDRDPPGGPAVPAKSLLMAPLRVAVFRRIWFASLLSNLGLLIQGVGAAWAMVQLHASAEMIALVQTALMLPILLISMASGALADMFDRRKVALFALGTALSGAICLTTITFAGLLSPPLILLFCFLIGSGQALFTPAWQLFTPAWQASIAEQLPGALVPQGVALTSISYNIARSFGPAVGGVVVAAAGAVAAFTVNALFYLPMIIVLLMWRRIVVPAQLPPERMSRAIVSGMRFIRHSPPIRKVLARSVLFGLAGGSTLALMPLIAKTLLQGNAQTFGLLLGSVGIGAVFGAILLNRTKRRLGMEGTLTASALLLSLCIAIVAFSRLLPLTLLALLGSGTAWTLAVTLLNINIQMSAPRWVAGRALAGFQASIAGGVAVGSWFWGNLAEWVGVSHALAVSAVIVALTVTLRFLLPLSEAGASSDDPLPLDEMDVALDLNGRSGPIIVEVDYRVEPANAGPFYRAMQDVQRVRHRNGAYAWSIARAIADPWAWTERFLCPSWHDYLRLRDRSTREEMAAVKQALTYHCGDRTPVVRRMLERPYGSVRWRGNAHYERLTALEPFA